MRRTSLSALGILLALLVAAPARAGDGDRRETWYAGYLGDKKAGWAHEVRERREEDGRTVWVFTNESEMTLGRAGTPVTIKQSATTVEDEAGRILRFTFAQAQGAAEMRTEGVVAQGKITLDQNGMKRVVPYPEGAIGQIALDRLLREKGIRAGTEIRAVVFMAMAPDRRVTTTFTIGEREKKDVLGRVVLLHRAVATDDLFGIPTTFWIDEGGEAQALSVAVPGLGDFHFLKTDESVARSPSEPAELFTKTFVEPDRPVANPRRLERLVVRLRKKGGEIDLYEGEGQRVLGRGEEGVEVEVRSPPPGGDVEAFTLPVRDEALASCLEPGPYVESDDEIVRKLAAEAVGEEKDARKAARLIEAFVRERITKKSLGVGFASAAEVARTLEGDCTEHGVLCCALARAVGLPARVVAGLVYLPPEGGLERRWKNGFFGYHMWTEVMVGKGYWLPIDAAIGAYDATHIALGKSDLDSASPQIDLVLSMLTLLGDLSIEVVEPR